MAGNNLNANLQFLQQYANNGGQAQLQNAQGQYVNATPQQVQQALQQAQGNQDNGQQQRQQAQQQQQQQQRQQQQQQQQAQRRAVAAGAAAGLGAVGAPVERLGGAVKSWSERAARVPTPGGLGLLLVILLILIFAIVPVNQGYTRLQLLWLTFLGQAYIPEAQAVEDARDSGQLAATSVANTTSMTTMTTDALRQGVRQGVRNALGKFPGAGGGNNGAISAARTGAPNVPSVPGAVIARPAYGQLPIAPPFPSTGRRGF